MSFWWEITSLVQLDLNHSLKWMQHRLKLMDVDEDEDEDVVVVVEEIPDTMVLIIIILRKWKPHCTTKSGTIQNGTILRQNETRQDVYKFILGWQRELFFNKWDGLRWMNPFRTLPITIPINKWWKRVTFFYQVVVKYHQIY